MQRDGPPVGRSRPDTPATHGPRPVRRYQCSTTVRLHPMALSIASSKDSCSRSRRYGWLLAARRQRVLDELVVGGVELHVTSRAAHDAGEFWPDLPHDLSDALVRRVRYLCRRVDRSPLETQRLRVLDLGWSERR